MSKERWLWQFVVVSGSPLDGIDIIGPFASMTKAHDYAEQQLSHTTWWVRVLIEPKIPVVSLKE